MVIDVTQKLKRVWKEGTKVIALNSEIHISVLNVSWLSWLTSVSSILNVLSLSNTLW